MSRAIIFPAVRSKPDFLFYGLPDKRVSVTDGTEVYDLEFHHMS
ncbi:MAG: hypothetical protein R2756_15640 [Bacteroidales bacterium]